MVTWKERPDSEVFGADIAGEQPGSQFAYERSVEIQRRQFVLEQQNLTEQRAAIAEQRAATAAQRDAIAEMKWQSMMMLWSVVGAFLAALATVVAAFIK